MKKILILSTLTFLALKSSAQSIDVPLPRVKAMLCKKWVGDYMIIGDKKISISINSKQYYDFSNDFKFHAYSADNKDGAHGIWEYVEEKRQIWFGSKNGYDTVFSLEENKLVTQVKVAKGTPLIFMVYKPLH